MEQDIDTLFICANFFGYAQEIKQMMQRRGRRVAWFEDRPSVDNFAKAAIRVAPWLMRERADKYFQNILEATKGNPIRDVLVVKGESLSAQTVRHMRATFPGARFTLYFWDSYRNMPSDTPEKVGLFDRAFTFDIADSRADPRLILRPLFFLEEYAKLRDVQADIDILFLGTVQSDRHAVLRRLENNLPKHQHFEKFLYLPARWVFPIRALTDPSLLIPKRSDLIFKPKSKTEVLALIARSRIIIDIERPIQSGYTMRTIEALGAGRKLITTNPEVAHADFFDSNNIAIIDRKAPRVSEDFLSTSYRQPPSELLKRYSLGGWLDDVLPN